MRKLAVAIIALLAMFATSQSAKADWTIEVGIDGWVYWRWDPGMDNEFPRPARPVRPPAAPKRPGNPPALLAPVAIEVCGAGDAWADDGWYVWMWNGEGWTYMWPSSSSDS